MARFSETKGEKLGVCLEVGMMVIDFPNQQDPFDVFWSVYPRRVAKKAARKAWLAALKDDDAQAIIEGAQRFRDHCVNEQTDARFIAHPATWLNQGRWEDEYELNLPEQSQAATDSDEKWAAHVKAGHKLPAWLGDRYAEHLIARGLVTRDEVRRCA